MTTIDVGRGQVVLIDADNYDRFSRLCWHTWRKGHLSYAVHNYRRGTRQYAFILMHHLVLPPVPGMVTDHINGNTLDNRRANLRNVTHSQSNMNRRKYRVATSRFKGVFWWKQKNRWTARIVYHGRLQHLGVFPDEEQAAIAYDKAARRLYKEYAVLNMPDAQT